MVFYSDAKYKIYDSTNNNLLVINGILFSVIKTQFQYHFVAR